MRTIVTAVLTALAAALLAVGDFGVGGVKQRTTGAAMRAFAERNEAQLLVTLGDNDYTRSATRFRSAWRASFGWLPAAGIEVAGVLGNHDVELARGRYQFATLGMPRAYYVRRVGDVELIVLDSTAITDGQTRWLRRVLARPRAGWRIVAFHHPPYTCGGHAGSATVRTRRAPLFARHGVSLVLSGHDHNYQRFARVRRVTYVVHGGGGAGLYPLRRCPDRYPRRLRARREHGFLYVTTTATAIVLHAVRLDGRIVDRVTVATRGGVGRS